MLLEEVSGEVEPVVKEVKVNTDIVLEGCLPGHAKVTRGSCCIIRYTIRVVDSEAVFASLIPHTVHIHESCRSTEVVTYLTHRSAELEVVDPACLVHPLFFRYHPTERYRWEETVTGLAWGEVLGTVVTGAHVNEISVCVAISRTSHKTNITSWKV